MLLGSGSAPRLRKTPNPPLPSTARDDTNLSVPAGLAHVLKEERIFDANRNSAHISAGESLSDKLETIMRDVGISTINP